MAIYQIGLEPAHDDARGELPGGLPEPAPTENLRVNPRSGLQRLKLIESRYLVFCVPVAVHKLTLAALISLWFSARLESLCAARPGRPA